MIKTNTREIKFRAWDGEKMRYLFDTPMDSYMVVFFHDCLLKGKRTFTTGKPAKTVEVTPMQYTGLKDKNGKEIYEGDVVRIQSESHKSGLVEVVKWIDPTNWVSDVCAVNGFVNHESIYKTKPEIIGNIYENPELLNHD